MKTITLPGSKSITNRDLILAALAPGISQLTGFLQSEDTEYMIQALSDIGIKIEIKDDTLVIHGGVEKINGQGRALFLGNSGTSVRFLTSLAILNPIGTITITGEERMKERPIRDLIDGIGQLGIIIDSNNGFCPLTIHGASKIEKSHVSMDGNSSSQYFTSLLQVAPLLQNGLTLEVIGDLVSKPYLDITINEMRKFGVHVINEEYKRFVVKAQSYSPVNMSIEGDASAMSYFAAYIVLHGGEITISNLSHTSRQGDYSFLDALEMFGLTTESDETSTLLRAPGLRNRDLSEYRDYSVDFEDMPDVSLTFMILAAFLPGDTCITGLKTLNLKESKRIDAMRDELQKLGIPVVSDNTSITIGKFPGFQDNTIINIETYRDHRIAMCFGVLDSFIGHMNILDKGCVSKTYPNFWNDLETLL